MNLSDIKSLDNQYFLQVFGERAPVCFVRGEGSTLYDQDGKAYTDLFAGIAVNALQIISTVMMVSGFDLENLLLSEKIIGITVHASLDATFLLAGAILLLLSYIFHHGEQLQQLENETL